MKKILSVFIAVVMTLSALAFTACAKKPVSPANTDEPAANVSELWEKAKAVSDFGEMTPVPQSDYLEIYGIDATKVEESVWYMSENPAVNADEIAIFKLSDAGYAETLAGIFRSRIDRQINLANTYSPDEASKLEKTEVVTEGSFVYFCVGDNYDAMINVLKTTNK